MAKSDKRIMVLLPAECFLPLVWPLVQKLRASGHTAEIICASPGPGFIALKSDHSIWNWSDFFFEPIEAFKPTSVLIWNGYAEHTVSATNYLKRRFNVAIMEVGWLPQQNSMYCLSDSAGVSGLKNVPFEQGVLSDSDRAAVASLKERYSTHWGKERGLPEKYIFVPMQLEYDTVIKSMSPDFKLMDKFIAYLLRVSPLPIVVKNHPKDPAAKRAPGVLLVDTLPAHIYAKYSEAVVGINSTVLVEAIVQHKRIVYHGDNVGEAVMFDGREFYGRPFTDIMNAPLPTEEEFDYRLALLLRNQYSSVNPPQWIVDRVAAGYFGARRFHDS